MSRLATIFRVSVAGNFGFSSYYLTYLKLYSTIIQLTSCPRILFNRMVPVSCILQIHPTAIYLNSPLAQLAPILAKHRLRHGLSNCRHQHFLHIEIRITAAYHERVSGNTIRPSLVSYPTFSLSHPLLLFSCQLSIFSKTSTMTRTLLKTMPLGESSLL
jgi:hypothetical protein